MLKNKYPPPAIQYEVCTGFLRFLLATTAVNEEWNSWMNLAGELYLREIQEQHDQIFNELWMSYHEYLRHHRFPGHGLIPLI